MTSKLTKVAVQLALALMITTPVFAQEQSGEINQDESSSLKGYFKVGLGYKNELTPYEDEVQGLSLFVNGRYQWHGFFIESFYGANERDEGVSFGYNFYNTAHWSFDINTVNAHGEIKATVVDNEQRFTQKFDSTDMIGLRATGSYDDITAQFMVAPFSLNDENDDGFFASAWVGKAWYVKNWEIYTSVGVKYYSEEFLDHYYEIPPEIATDNFSAYSPSDGFDLIGQVSASYPISENWVFESYLKYVDVSDEIMDNPIMDFAGGLDQRANNITEFGVLISYVF